MLFCALLILRVKHSSHKNVPLYYFSRCRINRKEIEIELAFEKNGKARVRERETERMNCCYLWWAKRTAKNEHQAIQTAFMNENWIYHLIRFSESFSLSHAKKNSYGNGGKICHSLASAQVMFYFNRMSQINREIKFSFSVGNESSFHVPRANCISSAAIASIFSMENPLKSFSIWSFVR